MTAAQAAAYRCGVCSNANVPELPASVEALDWAAWDAAWGAAEPHSGAAVRGLVRPAEAGRAADASPMDPLPSAGRPPHECAVEADHDDPISQRVRHVPGDVRDLRRGTGRAC